MSEKLLRVRVYDDDPEMVTVYEAYLGVRENSKSSRGFARRGVEGEFVRRLLVAGYRHLYGEFQPPQAMGAVARREPKASRWRRSRPRNRKPRAWICPTCFRSAVARQLKQLTETRKPHENVTAPCLGCGHVRRRRVAGTC